MKDQHYEPTPTAYFASLLALLTQSISASDGIVNKELVSSVVYLLDLVAGHVPSPLLRSKFTQILPSIAPILTNTEIEAPLIKSCIGCLESLLLAQDSSAWALPPTQMSPRKAMAGLLVLASDHRPKVRKRAQDAIAHVLQNPPPNPSLDHPVADLCAETAMHGLSEAIVSSSRRKGRERGKGPGEEHQPGLIHALQLVKIVASASGGWPSKKIEPLCEILMTISRSSNEYSIMVVFEIFELLFEGMANEFASSKLPRLMDTIAELRPLQDDQQLLPVWVAVISRAYEVSARIQPSDTFRKLPEAFRMISDFLASPFVNIRISASECLVSFLVNCISKGILLDLSIFDEKIVESVAQLATQLLKVKYQAARMEVLQVLSTLFKVLGSRSVGITDDIIKIVGELRNNESFNGKEEADAVLGDAVEAIGPSAILTLLPLNLVRQRADQSGRAWLLPILRDHVSNTELASFKLEFLHLSEVMFQKVIDNGAHEKTMETKVYETLVQQIWGLLPGYCKLPHDLIKAFDRKFAEMLANLLYRQPELRPDICKALQNLVESNQAVVSSDEAQPNVPTTQFTITKQGAEQNLDHLSSFAGNLLAVLFNVYSETLPQYRGYILQCINAYLSITPEKVFGHPHPFLSGYSMTDLDSGIARDLCTSDDNARDGPK